MSLTTLFHCSDLHFGHPAVPEQYEAIEALILERKYDVVAISGDVSQRARAGEFQRAREFIRKAEQAGAATIAQQPRCRVVVCALGLGDSANFRQSGLHQQRSRARPRGRRNVRGLNTSQGVNRHPLT